MKEQEVKGLLSSLGFRTQLSRIPLLGEDILFKFSCVKKEWNSKYVFPGRR